MEFILTPTVQIATAICGPDFESDAQFTLCGQWAEASYLDDDLGPENMNQQLGSAVGTLANMKFTSPSVLDLSIAES